MPAFLFAGELKIFVVDNDLDFPLEGARIFFEKKGTEAAEAYADEEGNAVIELPENVTSGSVTATLPGYKPVSVKFTGTEEVLTIKMSISSVIEGKELIVNRASPETTEEKTGVSTVITKEKMHTTANIGLVEDCMASVRTLPGVSYSGAWGSEPSVRGGEPRELGCLLDGMYLMFPYHWGGGYSIFNPAMVESIKLSNGVFSARYGRASSGILDATTLKPDYEHFHVNAGLSTTCADGFFQIPFGKNVGGMLLGAHLSYLDPFVMVAKNCGVDGLESMTRAPYIRDLFLKTNFTPTQELDISLIGFFGSDGVSFDQTENEKTLGSHSCFDYDFYQAVGGVNVKYLASDKLLFHGLLSYNGNFEDMKLSMTDYGTAAYNDSFVDKYGSVLPGVKSGASYSLPNLHTEFSEYLNSHLVTGRFESEIELTEKNHLCAGVEESFQASKSTDRYDGWTDIETPAGYLFRKVNFETSTSGNCIFDTAAFASWTYGTDADLIQTEFGLRGEVITLRNFCDDYTVNFIPDICPRATVTFTPWRDIGILEKASLTAGSGLFVSIPRETQSFTKEMGLKDYDINANRAILAVLGGDVSLYGGWKFKCEAYYKYYLSRIFTYETADASSGYQNAAMFAKSNGKGHVFGLDTMIEKKAGEKWDGYLSYSFVFSKFKNPVEKRSDQVIQNTFNDPMDEWYFPRFHRFHTINLVSNWHFGKGWTFTVKGTLATGAPKADGGNIVCYAAVLGDGTVIQRYTRSTLYSDSLRTNISCPVDLRLSYQWKSRNGKALWEYYFAVQDIFVNLYTPKCERTFNKYTGEMSDRVESADFSIGIPIPSVGLKVKF